ncbi:alpha-glucosidase [Cantharellus anzutake]|uniref:alpha-glucosidase n=1 Tax=Cantharellus anzutake TaxID=1750568 RepID=UPI0019073E6C|nr:alpha-glucosidase [Cantharellus anzutake]KAF8341539.1 alpha-glucosidase [Cantharellus anzutake]
MLLSCFAAALVFGQLSFPFAFDPSDFKTCPQVGFCRRGRALAKRATESSQWVSPYSVRPESVVLSPPNASLSAQVFSSLYPGIRFELQVDVLEHGIARVRLDEVNGMRRRYHQAASWALVAEPTLMAPGVVWRFEESGIRALYDDVELEISYAPLTVKLIRAGREELVLNGRGLLHLEHFRTKTAAPSTALSEYQAVLHGNTESNGWFEGGEADGYWEETFKAWTDSKPKGPESFFIDIDFPHHSHVYGIPQHATSLSLRETTGGNQYFSEPFRLYNNDIGGYDADSPMSLYGSIPLMHGHSTESTVGVFNLVASETWVDIFHPVLNKSTATHWISESGIMDIFLLPGPTPDLVFTQYASLTGTAPLPAYFALGYHQSRWNYISSQDVRDVSRRFDAENMPMDVVWLDIQYSQGQKYFIWDNQSFPDPVEMADELAAAGRKVVAIIDPHLKTSNDYPIFSEAQDKGFLVKDAEGEIFVGQCWPGSSAWLDFFNPQCQNWWRGIFSLNSTADGWRWAESTDNTFIWNDMNEPSVFNGPELTMPKDSVHYGGWEHRDVHNIYGMLFHKATASALVHRTGTMKRPFVLSRSFYAGSQRFGAIWTGDNLGTWEHMAAGIRMILSDGIAGMTFSGSDVGGFFGNPDPEMLVRWYQVGAFSPFFRAHAHIDTKRREPYLSAEPYRSMLRDILKLRYSLLPVWYNAFREASVSGIPVLRPQYVVFPKDSHGFEIDDQFYIGGSGLLVKPVTLPHVESAEVYLADDQVYYDYFDHQVHQGAMGGRYVTVSAPLAKVPLLYRGGSIVPTRLRPRLSSSLMKKDPFTLTVALDKTGSTASGELYLDDGETYTFEQGELVWRKFIAYPSKDGQASLIVQNHNLASHTSARDIVGGAKFQFYDGKNAYAREIDSVYVEQIIILGLKEEPKRDLEIDYRGGSYGMNNVLSSSLTIKNLGVRVVDDWQILVQW